MKGFKNVNEAKNWTLRKTFLLRRAVRPNNVVDRGKKFEIEDLFDFPKPKTQIKKEIKRNSSVSTVVLSEPEMKVRRLTRKKSEIYTINPNLNSNFTINTFSLSNMRLRKYTYNPKNNETKLKVVIAGSKFN
jgi:hypothetical protein